MQYQLITQQVQDAYRSVSKNMPGFRNRYTQRYFIGQITKTLCQTENDHRLLVTEGPTGTGKTLAYLLASIPVSQALNKKLVISSATVALQTQLVERDIPLIQKASGMEFSFMIAKGRGRYLCPSLLAQQVGELSSQVDAFATDDFLTNTLKTLNSAFTKNEWDGDKDRWENTISDEVWEKVSNDRHGCLSARCQYFKECPYFTAKAKLEEADVVVANHDLVLSDLALGGGILLPNPEETIYVIDEAHHLPDKTVNHAVTWASTTGTISMLDRAENILKQIEAILLESDTASLFSDINKSIKSLRQQVKHLIDYLNSVPELSGSNDEISLRYPRGVVPSELKSLAEELRQCTLSCIKYLNKLKDKITKAVNDNEISNKMAEAVLPEQGITLARLESLAALWNNLVFEDPNDQPPMARWVNKVAFKDHNDFRLFTSPISAATFLAENLWNKCYGAVLTSATLMSLGTFEYFKLKAGLPGEPETQYVQLASPFDFPNNATLWVPSMDSEPQKADEHTREIIKLLPELIGETTGSLVLFSSRRQMEEVADSLSASLQKNLLIQGDYNIQTLLEKHKEKIESKQQSIIMGLASFAEGIDLPGDLCTDVVIAKLPFPVPDSPVDATEREYLEAKGQSHFREVVLPQTCIRLIQAVGRLIRNESDTGKVSILDRRLVSKFYGKQLLQALPPMRRIIE